jgi:hypothetical protein
VKDGNAGIVAVGYAGRITKRMTRVFGKICGIKNFVYFRYHFSPPGLASLTLFLGHFRIKGQL